MDLRNPTGPRKDLEDYIQEARWQAECAERVRYTPERIGLAMVGVILPIAAVIILLGVSTGSNQSDIRKAASHECFMANGKITTMDWLVKCTYPDGSYKITNTRNPENSTVRIKP